MVQILYCKAIGRYAVECEILHYANTAMLDRIRIRPLTSIGSGVTNYAINFFLFTGNILGTGSINMYSLTEWFFTRIIENRP
jgi:hypothetical protein